MSFTPLGCVFAQHRSEALGKGVPIGKDLTQGEPRNVKMGGLRHSYHPNFVLSKSVRPIVCTAVGLWPKRRMSQSSARSSLIHGRNHNGRRVRRDARKEFGMNRLLMLGALAALLVGSTGCLHHNVRSDCGGSGCATCSTGDCSTGDCHGGCESGLCGNGIGGPSGGVCTGNCAGRCTTCGSNPNAYGTPGACVGPGCNGDCGSGAIGRVAGACGLNGHAGCRHGCIPGRLGWQQGGHDYSAYLQPGCLGHHAGDALNSRPFYPGPPTAHVGYPYYTHRGPRDFLLDNPPTIGR